MSPATRISPPSASRWPGEHLDQLALAVAGDAGDADDLSGADGERHLAHGNCAGIVARAESVELKPRGAGLAGAGRLNGELLGADHAARHRVRGEVGDLAMAGELAAPQDRDLVGERHHLAEFVRDHQNGQLALDHHRAQHAQDFVGFGRRQHRGRLVQDQEAPLQVKLLQDFAFLPLAGRDVGDL